MHQDQQISLDEIAIDYLKQHGKITDDLSLVEGVSQKSLKYLILVDNLLIGVWILDWKRSVGTDKIIHIERLLQQSNLNAAFVVSNYFSPNAFDLADQTEGIVLIERADILYHT